MSSYFLRIRRCHSLILHKAIYTEPSWRRTGARCSVPCSSPSAPLHTLVFRIPAKKRISGRFWRRAGALYSVPCVSPVAPPYSLVFRIAAQNPDTRTILETGWSPVLCAMLISSCGGSILNTVIRYHVVLGTYTNATKKFGYFLRVSNMNLFVLHSDIHSLIHSVKSVTIFIRPQTQNFCIAQNIL